MIDARPVVVQMLFMKANPSPKAAGLKRWNSFHRSMFCPMSFAAELHFNPYLQDARAAELCRKESVHGKIVDAESSRVQLLAEVIKWRRNFFN
jgi:hypothetical protein